MIVGYRVEVGIVGRGLGNDVTYKGSEYPKKGILNSDAK